MERSVPFYRSLPGLVRKAYTIGDDGKAGRMYLWESRAAAGVFYTDAWHARVRSQWGAPAEVSWFDAPVAIEGCRPQAAGAAR